MPNHAQITLLVKPQVSKSRPSVTKSNHEHRHANHANRITAGQQITLKSHQITQPLITKPTVPGGDRGSVNVTTRSL